MSRRYVWRTELVDLYDRVLVERGTTNTVEYKYVRRGLHEYSTLVPERFSLKADGEN